MKRREAAVGLFCEHRESAHRFFQLDEEALADPPGKRVFADDQLALSFL